MGCAEIMTGINYIAVVVSALIAIALGALWYSPALFGKAWMAGIGIKQEDISKDAATKAMIISMITTLIEIYCLAALIGIAKWSGVTIGIHVGILTGVGLVAAVLLSNSMYENRPFSVWLINAGYRALYFLIAGAILGAWQ
jgi:hypothetical protein